MSRLEYAQYAWRCPSTLINAFLHLEKVARFEQVEFAIDAVSDAMSALRRETTGSQGPMVANKDDPHDLVSLSTRVHKLKNHLDNWATELRKLMRQAGNEFPSITAVPPGLPLLDMTGYLEGLIDEYALKVRECDVVVAQVSMTFQMVRCFLFLASMDWHK